MLASEVIEPLLSRAVADALDEFRRSSMSEGDRDRLRASMDALDALATINGAPHASLVMSKWAGRVEELLEVLACAER